MNFEIEIISESYIGIDSILDFLNDNSLTASIGLIQEMDSWNWDNVRTVRDLSLVLPELEKGKIISGSLSLNSSLELGLYIESEADLTHYSFWFDIGQMESTKNMRSLYTDVYELIDSSVGQLNYKLRVCAVGVEMLFRFSGDMEQTAENSSGIEAYILPLDSGSSIKSIKAYTKKSYSHVCVFERSN